MMSNSSIRTHLLVLAFIALSLFVTIATFSWTTNQYYYNQDIIGKSGNGYFAGGTGTDTDPFIISNAFNLFNLAYLQDVGAFGNNQYYFKVADANGNPITIDFNNALSLYQTIKPIGTATYPFNGNFDGNYSTLANYGVDGTGLQDIGTFGFLGPNSTVVDLYLDQPTIHSNPSSTDDTSGYHTHTDDSDSVATGYIVGHLAEGAFLENIFVVSPTIDSLSSTYLNFSQFGLIGYS